MNEQGGELAVEQDSRGTSLLLCQHILEGNVESANRIIISQPLSNRDILQNHKIGGKWALHCLPPTVFQEEGKIEQTKALILKYMEAGWDVDSESENVENPCSSVADWFTSQCWREDDDDEDDEDEDQEEDKDVPLLIFSNITLLHLACCYESRHVIKLLVEQGADVNKSTGGNVGLSPLHISIMCHDWESALFLVDHGGSDPSSQGYFHVGGGFLFTTIVRPGETVLFGAHSFTATQLVLKEGAKSSLGLLERMLQGRESPTVADLHVGMEGGRPCLVSKILDHLPPDNNIDPDELNWVTPRAGEREEDVFRFPSFSHFLERYYVDDDLEEAADLLAALVERGYNCNLGGRGLIFDIMAFACRADRNNILLRKLLQFDHVTLGSTVVRSLRGEGPVEYALYYSGFWCMGNCWRDRDGGVDLNSYSSSSSWARDTVNLLIQHGADVSEWVVGPNSFRYHNGVGYKDMVKTLYTAGARFEQGFFETEYLCGDEERKSRCRAELTELREWIREREQVDKLNLRFKARIAVRKLLISIGHLRLFLDQLPLPPAVKDEVLFKGKYNSFN